MMTLREVSIHTSMYLSIYLRTMMDFTSSKTQGEPEIRMISRYGVYYHHTLRILRDLGILYTSKLLI